MCCDIIHNTNVQYVNPYSRACKDFTVVLENLPSSARFVNDEENGCRFEGQEKETWIYTGTAAARNSILEVFQTKLLNLSTL